jgi:HlyD family secretion protein
VLVALDHHAAKRPVVIGLKGEGSVEILDGVAQGDRLIPATAGIVSGQRVRIASASAATR